MSQKFINPLQLKPLIQPTINLNGTSGEHLLEQYQAVNDAFSQLLTALGSGVPHGRDYQLSADNGERLDARARDAWNDRRLVVHELYQEFRDLAEAVATQHFERNQIRQAT